MRVMNPTPFEAMKLNQRTSASVWRKIIGTTGTLGGESGGTTGTLGGEMVGVTRTHLHTALHFWRGSPRATTPTLRRRLGSTNRSDQHLAGVEATFSVRSSRSPLLASTPWGTGNAPARMTPPTS